VQNLSIEAIALVEATAPDVQAQAAAITFRMWHHLPSEEARQLLFADFTLDGRVVGLLEAIVATTRLTTPEAMPRLLVPAGIEASMSTYSTIEAALVLALREALGKMASSGVLNAWKQAFRYLTERLPA
jgi:hemoglobin-like flavoprotein